MLLNRIYDAENTINKYLEIQNHINRVQELEIVKTNVYKLKEKVMRYVKIRSSLNLVVDLEVDTINELFYGIEKIQKLFCENSIYLKDVIHDLLAKIDEIINEYKLIWNKYFNSNFSNILGTLKLLEKVVNNENISNIYRKIKIIGEKWPISKKDMENLNILIRQAEDIINKLDVSLEVQEFLVKTLNNKATVRDLNPKIIKWLKETDSDKNILLSFKK